MARIRSIKPDLFLHEELASISPHARLLFIGLWTLADKEGRLEDRPKRIKASLFPYEEVNVDGLLDELAAGGFVQRYESEGQECVSIPGFSKHQRPHPKETSFGLPPPPEPGKNTASREASRPGADASRRVPVVVGSGSGGGSGNGPPGARKAGVVGEFADAVAVLIKQRDPTWTWSESALRALQTLKNKGTPEEVLRRLRLALAWPRSFPTWAGLPTLVQHWDAYAQPASAPLVVAPDPDDPGVCDACGAQGSTAGWGDARLGRSCGCGASFLDTDLHYTEAPGWAASRRKEASHGH